MVRINSEENGELLPKQPGWEDTGRKIKGLLSKKQRQAREPVAAQTAGLETPSQGRTPTGQ